MITPSFGLTATERVLPKLALDFTTASLDSRITFTRTTDATHPATYVNSSGVVTAATNNQPRFDYDLVTLACKGLLIEESRTNLAAYSSDFSNAYWTKVVAASVTPDTTVSPDGTQNADTLSGAIGLNNDCLTRIFTVSSSTAYTFSIYIKGLTATTATIQLYDGSTGGTSATTLPLSSAWTRFSVTRTSGAATTQFRIRVGNTDGDVAIWGAQLETGAFATSYIPTTTAALTRNADVATMTGTNFSDWFNASEGTFSITASTFGTNTANRCQIDDGTTTNRYIVQTQRQGGSTQEAGVIIAGGIEQTNSFSKYSFAEVSTSVLAYKENSAAGCVNGSAIIAQDTSVTLPSGINRVNFSSGANGWIQKFSYYPQRISNAETQAFSKG